MGFDEKTRLKSIGARLGDLIVGLTTDLFEIRANGDTWWEGGGGLPYGHMWQHDAATTVAIATIGVAVNVGGFTTGEVHNVTYSSNTLVIQRAGHYNCSWHTCYYMAAGTNQEIEGAIGVNGVFNTHSSSHNTTVTAAETKVISAADIPLDLNVGDVITLMLLNETSTNDPIVEHASVSVFMVGG